MEQLYKFIGELEAGVFEQKLETALREAAMAAIITGKKATVDVKLTLKQISDTHQVIVNTNLKYKLPKPQGSASEENASLTPMHVGQGGTLSMFPEKQEQLFDKHGQVK